MSMMRIYALYDGSGKIVVVILVLFIAFFIVATIEELTSYTLYVEGFQHVYVLTVQPASQLNLSF